MSEHDDDALANIGLSEDVKTSRRRRKPLTAVQGGLEEQDNEGGSLAMEETRREDCAGLLCYQSGCWFGDENVGMLMPVPQSVREDAVSLLLRDAKRSAAREHLQ